MAMALLSSILETPAGNSVLPMLVSAQGRGWATPPGHHLSVYLDMWSGVGSKGPSHQLQGVAGDKVQFPFTKHRKNSKEVGCSTSLRKTINKSMLAVFRKPVLSMFTKKL